MKIRNDYVSNSSSSSFIIIVDNGDDKTKEISAEFSLKSDWNGYHFPCEDYKYEFGWEFENTTTFGDKLNFIGIQLLELLRMEENGRPHRKWKFKECYDMVKTVCKDVFNIDVVLEFNLLRGSGIDPDTGKLRLVLDHDYYIDHQSCVTEDSCMEMFESMGKLANFLRYNESYIEGGNDNYDGDEQ